MKPYAGVLKKQLERPVRPRRIGAAAPDLLRILDRIGQAVTTRYSPGNQPRQHSPEIPRSARTPLVRINRRLRINGRECRYDLAAKRNPDILKVDIVTFPAPLAELEPVGIAFLVFGNQRREGLAPAVRQFPAELLGRIDPRPEILIFGASCKTPRSFASRPVMAGLGDSR
jgi:hypothetical protein